MRYVPSDRLAVVEAHDAVFLAPLPDGPIIRLAGTAALIWAAALEDGDAILPVVSSATGVEPSEIAPDVEAFLADLIHRGLLAKRSAE